VVGEDSRLSVWAAPSHTDQLVAWISAAVGSSGQGIQPDPKTSRDQRTCARRQAHPDAPPHSRRSGNVEAIQNVDVCRNRKSPLQGGSDREFHLVIVH